MTQSDEEQTTSDTNGGTKDNIVEVVQKEALHSCMMQLEEKKNE